MLIETRTPSVSLIQRTFRIGYTRAENLLKSLEGELITPRNERGLRKMLIVDIRALEGALKRTIAYAELHNLPITVDVAKEAIKDYLPTATCYNYEGGEQHINTQNYAAA